MEHMAKTNEHFESLLVQNKKICALLSDMAESIYDIQEAVVVAQKPTVVAKQQPVINLGSVAEDSNSMPPPAPHAPFPDEKLNEI